MTEQATTRRLDRRAMKERTRQRLLDAATAVFARRGIEAASLEEVAEAAGYTKGAIYSNFTGKMDLIVALMERRIAEQVAAAEASLDGVTLEQGLQALDEQAHGVEGAERDWIVLAVEFWLLAMRDERARIAMAAQYEQARTITAELLAAKYVEAGVEPPLPARELAILIEALGVGVAVQSLLDPAAVSMGLQATGVRVLLAHGHPGPDVARDA